MVLYIGLSWCHFVLLVVDELVARISLIVDLHIVTTTIRLHEYDPCSCQRVEWQVNLGMREEYLLYLFDDSGADCGLRPNLLTWTAVCPVGLRGQFSTFQFAISTDQIRLKRLSARWLIESELRRELF